MLIAEIALVLSLILNQTAQGFIEGWIWADKKRKVKNPYIVVLKDRGNGFLDYHAWRLVENVGQLSAVVSAFYVGDLMSLALAGVGGWLMANFFYERALNIVDFGEWFPQKPLYKLMGIEIPHKPWRDWVILALGIGIVSGLWFI